MLVFKKKSILYICVLPELLNLWNSGIYLGTTGGKGLYLGTTEVKTSYIFTQLSFIQEHKFYSLLFILILLVEYYLDIYSTCNNIQQAAKILFTSNFYVIVQLFTSLKYL